MACVRSEPPRSPKQCRQILQEVDQVNPIIALMLEFSALTGLRYSDASQVRISDVYINGVIRDSITVVQTKSYNKRLTIYKRRMDERAAIRLAKQKSEIEIHFNEQCKELIADAYHINQGRKLLFESERRKEQPYSAQYVNRVLKAVAFKLKLTFELSTHSFRKSYAKMLIDNGGNHHNVRDALGHSSLEVTDKYLKSFMSESKNLVNKIGF